MLRRNVLATLAAISAMAMAIPVHGAAAQTGGSHASSFELYIEEIYERQTGKDVGVKVSFRDALTRGDTSAAARYRARAESPQPQSPAPRTRRGL